MTPKTEPNYPQVSAKCLDCASRKIDFNRITGLYVCLDCNSNVINLRVRLTAADPIQSDDDCRFF